MKMNVRVVNIAAVLLSLLKSFLPLLVCEEKTEQKVHGRLHRCSTRKRGKESEHCYLGGLQESLRKSTLLNTTRVELEFVYNEEPPGMESVSFMGDLSSHLFLNL